MKFSGFCYRHRIMQRSTLIGEHFFPPTKKLCTHEQFLSFSPTSLREPLLSCSTSVDGPIPDVLYQGRPAPHGPSLHTMFTGLFMLHHVHRHLIPGYRLADPSSFLYSSVDEYLGFPLFVWWSLVLPRTSVHTFSCGPISMPLRVMASPGGAGGC